MFKNIQKFLIFSNVLLLVACAPLSKHPFGGVEGMSADTLCYRAAYAAPDPAITAEINARHLECSKIL